MRPLLTLLGLALFLGLSSPAQAGLIGPYSLGNFQLINTCTDSVSPCVAPDGSVLATSSGFSLIGGNNGSGLSGVTDLTITAAAAGLVRFQYSYSSFDFPGLDSAGYLLGNVFHQLADTDGQASPVGQFISFSVNAGQTFGFRVATTDNMGEPGILSISNFTAPEGSSSVPEPGTAALSLIAGLAAAAYLRGKRR